MPHILFINYHKSKFKNPHIKTKGRKGFVHPYVHIYKDLVSTLKGTHCASIRETKRRCYTRWLQLFTYRITRNLNCMEVDGPYTSL